MMDGGRVLGYQKLGGSWEPYVGWRGLQRLRAESRQQQGLRTVTSYETKLHYPQRDGQSRAGKLTAGKEKE